jgi:HEAT repeat protein
MRRVPLSALVLLLAAAPVLGHGGAYRGPIAEVPPGSIDPDPVPPGPPEVLPLRRPDLLRVWLFWWHHNKDDLLHRRALSHAAGPDRKRPRLPEETIRERIVPALLATVRQERCHDDIRAGALVALGRIGAAEEILAERALDPEEGLIVREGAVLGLALDGRGTEVPRLLRRVANDLEAPPRLRCFALIGLGLAVRRPGIEDAGTFGQRFVEGDAPGSETALRTFALTAAGLTGDGGSLSLLLHGLDRGAGPGAEGSEIVRSAAATALGRVGGILPLLRLLDDPSLAVRRSAALALGPAVTEAAHLDAVAKRFWLEEDPVARVFLLASLGRAGARGNGRMRTLAAAHLAHALAEAHRTIERPMAALATGVLLSDPHSGDERLRRRLLPMLRGPLSRLRGEKLVHAAFALAAGFARDRSEGTREALRGILADRGQERRLRGAAAVALGLLGETEDRSVVVEALRDREDRRLRVDTALAAGLFGSPAATDALLEVMTDMKASQFVLGHAATALGWIRDASCVDRLIEILEPGAEWGEYPDLTRAMVTVALGRMARRNETPLLSRIARDYNFTSPLPAMDELLTIL